MALHQEQAGMILRDLVRRLIVRTGLHSCDLVGMGWTTLHFTIFQGDTIWDERTCEGRHCNPWNL